MFLNNSGNLLWENRKSEEKQKRIKNEAVVARLVLVLATLETVFSAVTFSKIPARMIVQNLKHQSTYSKELPGHSLYPNRFVILHGSIPIWALVNN